jgi:hypothetical protein
MTWRDKLDPTIKEHFEKLIKTTSNEQDAYLKSKKPSRAQLWTALAILSKKVSDLELEIKTLKKPKKENKKLKKVLKKL